MRLTFAGRNHRRNRRCPRSQLLQLRWLRHRARSLLRHQELCKPIPPVPIRSRDHRGEVAGIGLGWAKTGETAGDGAADTLTIFAFASSSTTFSSG